MADYSPEKAGVGGSIPSLAAIFSSTCIAAISQAGVNWRQKTGISSPFPLVRFWQDGRSGFAHHHSRGLFDRSPLRVRYELRLNIQGGLNARVA